MKPSTSDSDSREARDILWPVLIAAGLVIVVVVNFTFIWIAVDGQDQVVESYVTEAR